LCNRSAERLGLNVVGETAPAVDLDDRDPLPVDALERLVAGDVDLAQVEVELTAERPHLRERALAEMAALRVVDDDLAPRDRCPA
jgi:hypothetical protein